MHNINTAGEILRPRCIYTLFRLCFLLEWILSRIRQRFWLIVSDILYPKEPEHLEERLAVVTERYCSVMRISLLKQYIAVESAHLRNCKDANASE